MHQYLLGHGCWSYVDGANVAAPDAIHRYFPAWEQAANKVIYYFTSNVGNQLLAHIQDAKMPKEAWRNLKRVFAASTMAQKLKLKHKLSNVWQKDVSMVDYTTRIKEICLGHSKRWFARGRIRLRFLTYSQSSL